MRKKNKREFDIEEVLSQAWEMVSNNADPIEPSNVERNISNDLTLGQIIDNVEAQLLAENHQTEIKQNNLSQKTDSTVNNTAKVKADWADPMRDLDNLSQHGVVQKEQVQLAGNANFPEEDPERKQLSVSQPKFLEYDGIQSGLLDILETKKSGTLFFEFDGAQRQFIFENGALLWATSDSMEDRLSTLLLREGRINKQQHDNASMKVATSGQKAGSVLVENGLISQRELFPLVCHHYEWLVTDSFKIKSHDCYFESGFKKSSERIFLDVPIESILLQCIIDSLPSQAWQKGVSVSSKIVFQKKGIGCWDSFGINSSTLKHIESIRGGNPLDKVVSELGEFSDFLLKTIYALFILKWLSIDGKMSGLLKSLATSPGKIRGEQRLKRQLIQDKSKAVNDGSYYAILEVAPDASEDEIRRAYKRLQNIFNREKFTDKAFNDLQIDIEVILDVLAEAREILEDPELKRLYRQHFMESDSV